MICLVLLLGGRRRRTGFNPADYRAKPLLSAWEAKALAEIQVDLPRVYYAYPQVRLADAVAIMQRNPALCWMKDRSHVTGVPVVVRWQFRRGELLISFLASSHSAWPAWKPCGTSHNRAREITLFGHIVKVMRPAYAKSYVKRSKIDDAHSEAVMRPTMRFVATKIMGQQGHADQRSA